MKNLKNKKGEMLVETVVAMTVFAIVMTVSFAAFKSFSKLSQKEKQYTSLEGICLDIDKYYDFFGNDFWAQEYFGDYYVPAKIQRYDENCNITSSTAVIYSYELTYSYDETLNEDGQPRGLVINIVDQYGETVIENLEYGPSQSTTINDVEYYQKVMANNIGIKVEEFEFDDTPEEGEEYDIPGHSSEIEVPENPFGPLEPSYPVDDTESQDQDETEGLAEETEPEESTEESAEETEESTEETVEETEESSESSEIEESTQGDEQNE